MERPEQIPQEKAFQPFTDMRANRIIRLPELKLMTGYSRSSIYSKISKGIFPKPIILGGSVGWLETDVLEWIEERSRMTPLILEERKKRKEEKEKEKNQNQNQNQNQNDSSVAAKWSLLFLMLFMES